MTQEVLDIPGGDVQSAIAAGRLNATPHELQPGRIYAVTTANGDVKQIDLTDRARELPPERKTGVVRVADVASFGAYFGKHADPDSEIYADLAGRTVTAVLDAHRAGDDGPGYARHGGHRLVYTAAFSEAFAAWQAVSDKPAGQELFAEFIEERVADIVDPAGSTMLEIAQTLEGHTAATWSSGHRLSDGQRQITWSEQNEARAGTGGRLTIPDTIRIRVQVFAHATQVDELVGRFRYRITSGGLKLWIKLHQPEDVVRAAFEDVIGQIAEVTGRTGDSGRTGGDDGDPLLASSDQPLTRPPMGVLRGRPS